jgi:hypothetical protein
MARAFRTDFAGALHHLTSRGNERRPIFYEDRDREMCLSSSVRLFGASAGA